MEIIKINCEKIKISLSVDDMDNLNINYDMLDGVNECSKKAFNKILDRAKDECGFVTTGKRIFVQIFPSKDGGCEMFVTKLNELDNKYSLTKRKKEICYYFTSIEDMLQVCLAAKKAKLQCVSKAYFVEDTGTYYLCLDKEIKNAIEYGGHKCINNTEAYLDEHYTPFTSDAINKLSAFALDG